MIKKLTNYFLCILFCAVNSVITAQETYKGSFNLTDSITGQAEYSFKERGSEQIFDGEFKFQYAKQFDETYKSINYRGEFSNNRKNGRWLLSSKQMVKSDALQISDYEISYNASGFEYRVNSAFKNGRADGDWSVIEQNFENTVITDTLFYAEVSFKDALMTNNIQANSQHMTWQGLFDENGFADGQWIISHKINGNIIDELRVYENGVFKTQSFIVNGTSTTIEHYGLDTVEDEEESNWEVLNGSKAYFRLFELSNSKSQAIFVGGQVINLDAITQTTHQFLEKAIGAFAYYKTDEIWNLVTNEQRLELGKFKVRKFPFTEDERQLITEISKYNKGITQLLNQFFKDPQVEIGKLSFKSLNRYYAIFEEYKKYSPEISKLATIITDPSLEYLDRRVFIKNMVPEFEFQNEIQYSFQEEEFTENHSFPTTPSKEDFNLKEANTFLKTIHENLKTELKNATVVFNDLRKIEALTELEEALVKKRNTIQSLFSNQNQEEDYNQFHSDINSTVQAFVEEQLKAYSVLSLDEKKQQIDTYLSCFDAVLELYDFMSDLPIKISRLEELYTRITFNPYIMVDMEERVKERLYDGYAEIVLPFLLEKIKNEFSCTTITDNSDHIKNLINKMSQLREQDTSLKEKQLRREKDPIRVLSILELDITDQK